MAEHKEIILSAIILSVAIITALAFISFNFGNLKNYTENFSITGKFFTALNGAGFLFCLNWLMSSYLQMDKTCEKQMYYMDSIKGARTLSWYFFILSLVSMLSVLAPIISVMLKTHIIGIKRSNLGINSSALNKENIVISRKSWEIISFFQAFIICFTSVWTIVVLLTVMILINGLSLGGTQLFWLDINNSCEEMVRAP